MNNASRPTKMPRNWILAFLLILPVHGFSEAIPETTLPFLKKWNTSSFVSIEGTETFFPECKPMSTATSTICENHRTMLTAFYTSEFYRNTSLRTLECMDEEINDECRIQYQSLKNKLEEAYMRESSELNDRSGNFPILLYEKFIKSKGTSFAKLIGKPQSDNGVTSYESLIAAYIYTRMVSDKTLTFRQELKSCLEKNVNDECKSHYDYVNAVIEDYYKLLPTHRIPAEANKKPA